MVQHLGTSLLDATSNSNDGTNVNTVTTTGKIGTAREWDSSSDEITFGTDNSLNLYSAFTFSGWYYPTTPTEDYYRLFDRFLSGTNDGYRMLVRSGTRNILVQGNTGGAESAYALTLNVWAKITFILSGTSVKVYENGVLQATITVSFTTNSAYTFYLGGSADASRNFRGKIEQFTATASVRTVDWDLTEYNNQNSPSTFWTAGNIQTATVSSLTTTLTLPAVTAEGRFTAAVASLSTTLTLPAVTATAQFTAAVASLTTALTLTTTTATYIQIETSAVSPLVTTLTLVDPTATYAAILSAAVAPLALTLTDPGLTASYFAVLSAAVSPLETALTLTDLTCTYIQIETPTVAPLETTLTLTALAATATKFAGQSSAVVLTLTVPSIKVIGWAQESLGASSWDEESASSESWDEESASSESWTQE